MRTHVDEIPLLAKRYSLREELVHSVTHGVGALLSAVGVSLLVVQSSAHGRGAAFACGVYGLTLIAMYAASSVYHAVPFSKDRLKRICQAADHCAIYLLIAGTYTPFMLISLRGGWGFCLLSVIWLLALVGTVERLWPSRRGTRGRTLLYLSMGWLALLAIRPLMHTVPLGGLVLLVLGGAAYSIGILFYAWQSLRYHHAIWHAFVLMGSVLHFFAIALYVVPHSS
ncbi:MAG TPA: hemolysin III family protein [Polyangiaceae bacterium]